MDILSKAEEIEDITTQNTKDCIATIVEQIRLALHEDEQENDRNCLDNQSSYGDIFKILYTLIEPLASDCRKEDGKTQNQEQWGVDLNLRNSQT